MKILPLILASILITTSSLLAEDVEKVTIDNKTPYDLFLDLDTKPTRTGQMIIRHNSPNTSTNHKFNLENTPIAYDIGFSGNPKPDSYGTATQIRQQDGGTYWNELKGDFPHESLPNNGISNADLKEKVFNPDITFKYDSTTKTLKITIEEYK